MKRSKTVESWIELNEVTFMISRGFQLLLCGRWGLVCINTSGSQLQGAVEDKDRKKEEDVEDGEDSGNLTDGALCVWVLLQVGRVGVVEVAAPVGEDDGQGTGDEGDHPQPRLGVASIQQAQQGSEKKETEEDVNVPEKYLRCHRKETKRELQVQKKINHINNYSW